MIRQRYFSRTPQPPATVRQEAMPRHKYQVGQMVTFLMVARTRTSRAVEKSIYDNDFEIMRLLPTAGEDFQYRIRNARTGQERVVAESEINLADA